MKYTKIHDDLTIIKDDGACDHLINQKIPEIALPNQRGNLLKLNRITKYHRKSFEPIKSLIHK